MVQAFGAEHLVLETDCPDMTPLCCQLSARHRTRNTPVNLPYVLQGLSTEFGKCLNLNWLPVYGKIVYRPYILAN